MVKPDKRHIIIDIKECRNCKTIQWPRLNQDTMTLKWSKTCKNPKCKSPYWDKPRMRYKA